MEIKLNDLSIENYIRLLKLCASNCLFLSSLKNSKSQTFHPQDFDSERRAPSPGPCARRGGRSARRLYERGGGSSVGLICDGQGGSSGSQQGGGGGGA